MSSFDPNRPQRPGMWRRDQGIFPPQRREARGETPESRQLRSMQWRAAGAQFYPGGAYEQLSRISYRGRGPKGYQRSDELLKEIICEELTDDPFIDARNVSIEVSGGEVTLRGTVEARQQKYAIEDAIADIAGVTQIRNDLSVMSPDIEDQVSDL